MRRTERMCGLRESLLFTVVFAGLGALSPTEAKASFMVNSTEGLASVLADRMACPKSPKDRRFMMNGETMYWHLKESLRNDFKEICRVTVGASEDLVGASGSAVSSRVQALEAHFLKSFINRYEARSAFEANETITAYAKVLAAGVADIRAHARASKKRGASCSNVRNSVVEKAIRSVYTSVLKATSANRNRSSSSNDCSVFYKNGWKPWHVGRYSQAGAVPGLAKINRAVAPSTPVVVSTPPAQEPVEEPATAPSAPLVLAPAPAPVVNVRSGDGFQSVSGEGVAKVIADRFACPVVPGSSSRISNDSMFSYTRQSLRHDFIENCDVKLSSSENLISGSEEKMTLTNKLREEIEGHFLNRFALRSGVQPNAEVKAYAKRFADAVVDIRVHARRMARKGFTCKKDADTTVTAIASRLKSGTAKVMSFTRSNTSAANDCAEFKKEDWKPWKDQDYSENGEVVIVARTRHDENTPVVVQPPAPVVEPEPEPAPVVVVEPEPAPVVEPEPAPVVPSEPIVVVTPGADSDAIAPANFLKNSGIGVAYLLADRMACPKRPNDDSVIPHGTQFWYAKQSLIHDFAETCKASLGGGADLVKRDGSVNEPIAAQLRAQIKKEFLRRYEARSGLVPVGTVAAFADKLASTIVKIRIEAREDKNAGRTCSNAGNSEAQKLAASISASLVSAAKSHASLRTNNADCASFRKAGWGPWEDKPYATVKDSEGRTHVGIVASLPGIKDIQRQGDQVEDGSSSGDTGSNTQYDAETALSAFNSGNYPEEKYDGDVLFSKSDYNQGLMPGVPYVGTSIGKAKSNDFDSCGNIVVITHRTLRDTFLPSPTHFTIGRGGEIMQHGPIQNGMPGSAGHNACAVHVAFSGGVTEGNNFRAITAAQVESGGAVLAFISDRIEKLYSIQIQLNHGVTRAGSLFGTTRQTYSRSAVVQDNELSLNGENTHAKDHVTRSQMDQVLAKARAKFATLNNSQKPILDAQTVARSVVTVQTGVNNGGWQRKMHTPHPLGRYVQGADEEELPEEEPEEEEVEEPTSTVDNPYVVLGL